MRSETPTPSASPNGKRSRDPEDDVYFDNLNSHKRYLTEMMASSLNGLTVGDTNHTMPETIMDSPARSESMFYLRDEMSLQYSPMSEDLDDLRYCETPMSACSSQSGSRPTSPVSPYRYKPVGSCSSPPTTSMQSEPRQRGSDTEGRFPSSPSDICHSSDLRKAALLRSVQMRAQPSCSSSFDLGFNASQEPMQNREVETRSCSYLKPSSDVQDYHAEMQSCSYMKPMDDERDYHIEKGSSMASCALSFNAEQEAMGTIEGETPSCSYMKPLGEEEHRVEGCSSLASAKHVISATQEPMLSIEAEPLSCSYMKPLDDGHK